MEWVLLVRLRSSNSTCLVVAGMNVKRSKIGGGISICVFTLLEIICAYIC